MQPGSRADAAAPPVPSVPLRLLVVLPALNEEESVTRVIDEVRRTQPHAAVLVVDDGSTDRTALRAEQAGALVLSLPFNLGVGGAMRAAFRYARVEGYTHVVQVDADGQHDPSEIDAMLEASRHAEVVVGARFAGRGSYDARGPRRWGMWMLSRVLSRLTGTRLTDPTSGFRLATLPAIAVFARHYPEEYLGDTVESLVIAHRVGLRIAQVPTEMRARTTGQASQSAFRSTVYLFRVLSAVALALVRAVPHVDPRDLASAAEEVER